jgi:uncharacterized protein DUF3105
VPRWALLAGAVALVFVAAAVAALVAYSGRGSVAATMRAVGCTYRDVTPYPPKDSASDDYHADFPTLSTPAHWSTFPPSGGGHYRLWAIWSFYRKPVNPRQVVHNEEHGGVIIWWGPKVPAGTVDELQAFYRKDPVGVLGTPIAGLGDRIALTAWTADPRWKGEPAFAYQQGYYGTGRIAVCPRFDEHAFARFRDAYRGHSPQGFPLEGDRPGCGPTRSC